MLNSRLSCTLFPFSPWSPLLSSPLSSSAARSPDQGEDGRKIRELAGDSERGFAAKGIPFAALRSVRVPVPSLAIKRCRFGGIFSRLVQPGPVPGHASSTMSIRMLPSLCPSRLHSPLEMLRAH